MRMILILSLIYVCVSAGRSKPKEDILTWSKINMMDEFPQRGVDEAAVIEWGNSAVISALDAVVAGFGAKTSRGAFFEVETSPILSEPISGINPDVNDEDFKLDEYDMPVLPPLLNKDEIIGNMAVMTNAAGLSGVQMARLARDAGAAALCVVNVQQREGVSDDGNGSNLDRDAIFMLHPEHDGEERYAAEHIDFPVVMISLNSGNILTTASMKEDQDYTDQPPENNGMPDRIRLYAAGDRPFFEDLSPNNPLVYLIHNLLAPDECKMLRSAIQSYSTNNNNNDDDDDALQKNLLESINRKKHKNINDNSNAGISQAMLWKGPYLSSHSYRQIDERIEQVTGYPQTQFSDWQITKYEEGQYTEFHHDHHPLYLPLATITVFLNTVEDGQVIFPHGKFQIKPTQGLAIVHHNYLLNELQAKEIDQYSRYGELPPKGTKYVVKKFIYSNPPTPTKRIILPILALGSTLPAWVIRYHHHLIQSFGVQEGEDYFDKSMTFGSVIILFILVSSILSLVQKSVSSSSSNESTKKTKKKKNTTKKNTTGKSQTEKSKKLKKNK